MPPQDHETMAHCKDAQIVLDTDLAGRRESFNPAELVTAAVSTCIVKGIERVTPLLKFQLRSVTVQVHGVRQDATPKLDSIGYEIVVDTDEDERRLALLHDNVKKFGTVFNTVAPGTDLSGVPRRLNPNDRESTQ